jgi:hypothetical protein
LHGLRGLYWNSVLAERIIAHRRRPALARIGPAQLQRRKEAKDFARLERTMMGDSCGKEVAFLLQKRPSAGACMVRHTEFFTRTRKPML